METCSGVSNWIESSALTTVHLLSGSLPPALSNLTSPSLCCHIKTSTKHLSPCPRQLKNSQQCRSMTRERAELGHGPGKCKRKGKESCGHRFCGHMERIKVSNSPFLKTAPGQQKLYLSRFLRASTQLVPSPA